MKLNDAIDIKVGNKQVKYVYCGDYFVWGCSIIKYTTNNSVEPDITLFYKPENITKVTSLYDAANNYGEVRFYGSSKITEIPFHLFSDCSNVTSIIVPDGISEIGGNAFSGCSSLSSILLPDSITEISNNAFSGCSSLTHIDIPDSVKEFGDWIFTSCSNLQTIKLSNNLTSIPYQCFSGCSSLSSLTIPSSVEEIEYQAFFETTSLNELVLNDGLKVIWKEILRGSRLKTLVVPETVEKLHYRCFYNAVLLESIYFKSTTPPEAVFSGPETDTTWSGFYKSGSYTATGKTTIYVPIGSGDLYRNAAGWNEFANQIVEFDFNT